MQINIRKILGIFIVILEILTITVAPAWSKDNITLQREWTANAEFAGDVSASQIATNRGFKLEVREGSELVDPIKMVRSGGAQFGVASADRILEENEGGADLIVLGAATFRSPVVFLTQSRMNVVQPRDFVGRTIGIQPGTNTELVFNALAKSQGIALKDMKVVDSGWGTQMFETGAIDVLGAFAYDEPISLEMKKFPMGKMINPEEYGVRYIGTVYFTRKALISEHPDIVQAFMNVLVDGWKQALANPREAINLLAKKFQSVQDNIDKERRSFDAGRQYFGGEDGHVLYASKDRWTKMTDSLVELGKLRAFDFNANIDYRFLDKAAAR